MKIGGWTKTLKTAAVIDTGAYTSGDNIGGLLTLSNATRSGGGGPGQGGGLIQVVRLVDQDNEKREIDIVFFDENPTGTTITNNVALDIADADMAKVIGHVTILATDYVSYADNAIATRTGLGLAFSLASGTTLYAAMVIRDTPTYTATTDIAVAVVVLQD